MAKVCYLHVEMSSWKAEKIDVTEGDVKVCSKKSVDNFIKGSLKLIVEKNQPNISIIMTKMRDRGFIRNQNIMEKSSYTNNLEVDYIFSCKRYSIIRTDLDLECGQHKYDETKEVVVEGIHYFVEFKGEINCTGLTKEESEVLCKNDPLLNIGVFVVGTPKPVAQSETSDQFSLSRYHSVF
nr:TPA_asm: M [Pogostemom alphacytorhabdovirus 3_Lag]